MPSSDSILSKEKAEGVIFNFKPREFIKKKDNKVEEDSLSQPSSGFKINELSAYELGLTQKNENLIEEKIHLRVLEEIKSVQEEAYQKAYALGLEEGAKKAFEVNELKIKEKIDYLDTILKEIERMKIEIFQQNENQFIKFAYYLSEKIAMTELEKNPEKIIEMMKEVIEMAQCDEQISLIISASDFDFISEFKNRLHHDVILSSKVQIIKSDQLKSGGCMVETNFGSIDASIQQRIEKCWEIIKPHLNKPKEKFE